METGEDNQDGEEGEPSQDDDEEETGGEIEYCYICVWSQG